MTSGNEGSLYPTNYFSAHVRILRIFGLWPYRNSGVQGFPKETLYRVYQVVFLFTFAYLFTVLEIIQLYYSWRNFDDFINNLCYAIVHVMACSKISLVLYRARDIQALTTSFETGILKICGNRATEEPALVEECVLRTRKLLKIYFIIGTSVVTNGLLCPLYISSDTTPYLEIPGSNGSSAGDDMRIEKTRKLPYMSYFPFDVNLTPYHELAYAYQGICLMTLSPIIVTTDILYGSILLHIATQLRVLGRTLISLRSIAIRKLQQSCKPKSCGKIHAKLLETEIYESLKNCVLHHYAIISLTEDMERLFSILVLLQFLCNLVIMCFPLFQITSVPVMSFPFFSMVSLMTAMMYQLFIFCNCGDDVTQQSLLIADAAYFSNWFGQSDSSSSDMQRAVLLIIGRARRPLRLTVAKFAILSRETFLRVVQGSASYFMFLHRIRNDQ